jgi:alkylated DNA repair dioxygenase AlkB
MAAAAATAPQGLVVSRGQVDAARCAQLLAQLDGQPWSTTLSRRTQHYGGVYNYLRRSVDVAAAVPLSACAAVEWGAALVAPVFAGLGSRPPTTCIVNEYTARQAIAAHTDAACFGPVVATLSLGDAATMRFTKVGEPPFDAVLAAGDVVIMHGAARNAWKHETRPVATPTFRRVSMTYRALVAPP